MCNEQDWLAVIEAGEQKLARGRNVARTTIKLAIAIKERDKSFHVGQDCLGVR